MNNIFACYINKFLTTHFMRIEHYLCCWFKPRITSIYIYIIIHTAQKDSSALKMWSKGLNKTVNW